MKRGSISINRNSVTITGNVWMADFEIAELLGITYSAIRINIKAIYKSRALQENDTYQYFHLENGNRANAYNLEMITALAFRLNSLPAKVFRQWVVQKVVMPIRTEPSIVVQLKDNSFLC